MTKDSSGLKGFAIAGRGKKFVWTTAIIKNNKLRFTNMNVAKPVAVRYGWGSNRTTSLYNKANPLASSFKRDGFEK